MKVLNILLSAAAVSIAAAASSYTYTETVRVEHSKPLYETVTERIPHTVCNPLPGVHRSHYSHRNDIGLDTLIGAAAGVAIGHQIGKGEGRAIAKVVGGIAGAHVANSMRKHHRHQRRECRTTYEVIEKSELNGYKNIAWYKGKRLVKHSKKPLHYITLTHTISY